MKFGEIVTQVLDTTKRPQLINTIYRKINAAISFYCLDNDFDRDFMEVLTPITATEYKQALPISSLQRFRKMRYVKYGGSRSFILPLPASEMFQSHLCPDRYYIVGDNINLNLGALASNLDIGYYKYPPLLSVADGNDTFWLIDVAPFMVIDRACAEIFRDVGDEKSMQAHFGSANDAYRAARKDLGIANQ